MGINRDCEVICYDDSDGISACQAACYFQNFGFTKIQVVRGKFSETWPAGTPQVKADKNQLITKFDLKKTDFAKVNFAEAKRIADTNAPPPVEASMLGAAGNVAGNAGAAAQATLNYIPGVNLFT